MAPGPEDSWRGETTRGVGTREVNETIGTGLGLTMLSSLILALSLIIGGIEQNPGPAVETENTVRVLCTGCGRNLKSGIKCEV